MKKILQSFGITIFFTTFITIAGCSGGSGNSENASAPDPQLEIAALSYINLNNQGGYSLNGSCSGSGEEVSYLLSEQLEENEQQGISYQGEVICENGSWSIDGLDFSQISDGKNVDIEVSFADKTINETITKDVTPPVMELNAIDEYVTSGNERSFTLDGTCGEDGTVSLRIGSFEGDVPCTVNNGWSVDVDLAEQYDGPLVVTVDFQDTAGNVVRRPLGDKIIKETAPLHLAITSLPHINGSNLNGYQISGECEQGNTIDVELRDSGSEQATSEIVCDSNDQWTAILGVLSFAEDEVSVVVTQTDAQTNATSEIMDSITKDTMAPEFAAGDIGVPDDNSYTGGRLDFTISYNEKIIVDTTSGHPRLEITLETNNRQRYALYRERSGTTSLIFSYVIESGDAASSGITVSDDIDLDGGTLKDIAGNDAPNSGLSIPSLNQVTVDGTAPSLTGVSGSMSKTYLLDEEVTLAASFSQAVTITGGPELILQVGDQTAVAIYSGTGFDFTYTVLSGHNDSDGIIVTGIDLSRGAIVDSNDNALNLTPYIQTPYELSDVLVDTGAPRATGLIDDRTPVKNKTWTWQCDDQSLPCEYRFAITMEPTHVFDSELYGSTAMATTQDGGDGIYYLHLQLKDNHDIESEVLSYMALLDNTPPGIGEENLRLPQDGTYGDDDTLTFTIVYDEDVKVSGTPYFTFDIGGEERRANYLGGEEFTRVLAFSYDIQRGDQDSDGIILGGSIEVDSASSITIQDEAGNDASTDLSSIGAGTLAGIQISTSDPLPTLADVTAVAAAHKEDDDVILTASFSDAVTVMGSPELVMTLKLNSQLTSVRAIYDDDGTSKTEHDFLYTVEAGHNGTEIKIESIQIDQAQGQSITGSAGAVDAVSGPFNVTVTGGNELVIDTQTPVITGLSNDSIPTRAKTWSWGCDESDCDYRSAITTTESNEFDDNNNFSATHNTNEQDSGDGTYYIHVQAKDPAGNVSEPVKVSAVLDNTAPAMPFLGTAPFSPSYDTTPYLLINSILAEDTVKAYASNDCTGDTILDRLAGGTEIIHAVSALSNGNDDYYFSVKAVDVAGNEADCTSTQYTLDTSLNTFTPLKVESGGFHSCALSTSGVIKCWGNNEYGQLGLDNNYNWGDGVDENGQSATEMGANLAPTDLGDNYFIRDLVLGTNHSCVLFLDGSVKCWGRNEHGQLGQDSDQNLGDDAGEMAALTAINLGMDDQSRAYTAKAINAGGHHTCAILNDDKLKCWGRNDSGQLGIGGTDTQGDNSGEMAVLSAINLGTNLTAKAIDLGSTHTCVILSNDLVKCWGDGANGKLGQNSEDSIGSVEDSVANLTAINLGVDSNSNPYMPLAIRTGQEYSCALLNGDSVKCWGRNHAGQLGQDNNTNYGTTSNPMSTLDSIVFANTTGVRLMDARNNHTCALFNDDSLKCWGYGLYGRLGYGNARNLGTSGNSLASFSGSIDLGGESFSIADVSAGYFHSCAISSSNEVKCWGRNHTGQLGQDSTEDLGDEANELGTNLDAIDFGTIAIN